MAKQKNSESIPVESQQRIRAIIDKHGTGQAAKFLGISVHAMERAAGGLNCHRGTASYLAQQIAERDKAGKVP
jgi:methionine synthase I (cobalamin-dependent)